MQCRKCGNEMLVYSTEERENTLIFHYKCANPNCPDYDYKRADDSREKDE